MSFVLPLAGGVLIGIAAVMLLLFNGRIAGISGVVAGLIIPDREDFTWRAFFVGGLVVGGLVLAVAQPAVFPRSEFRSLPALAVAGLLVGAGARLGGGCTSGHGVCGIGRASPRGLLATITFMATGAITVWVVNHYFGGTL